ncbi:hypothetical protein P879_08597 [Paragonimus westermani]|uniref:HMG box domain-containing protein n=1 Tax=Paragonimus westermani TaxID=34504 RepID=A0A8T0DM73_9TREM|nr:hypothetical protein P879_08597 [Paragonimus westermani]
MFVSFIQEPKTFFLQSPHSGSSGLQSAKMNSKGEIRTPKPPKPPEKPLMPYMRYSRKVWEQVKNSNPHLKLWEVGKIIGQMWRELPDDEKTLYIEEYDAEKTQYTEALRQYHSSPAYQAWLVAKERAEKLLEEQDQERKQSMARSRDRPGDVAQADLRESYILEDNEEDAEDQYTAKHVAAARFQRNHRLMQEILSDSRLPEPGQLITQSRLNMLRLQVEQLKNHKRNLCLEIEGCELRHRSKLLRIQEESDKFVAEYQKLSSTRPMITEPQFAEMIVKAKHDIQREEEERHTRYLAEFELRRRKQQQQRQQREAELAADAERRRQQLQQQQQQAKIQQAQASEAVAQEQLVNERSAERLPVTVDTKQDLICNNPSKSPAPTVTGGPSSKPAMTLPDLTNQNVTMPYPTGMSAAYPHGLPAPSSQRMLQPGHTQHHYPPPPNYPPNALSPTMGQQMGLPPRGTPPVSQQMVPNSGVAKTAASMPLKKNPSSVSSTSSASSASSSSSKKKKSDMASATAREKKSESSVIGNAASMVTERRGFPGENLPEPRSAEMLANSAPPAEFLQAPVSQSQMVRHPAAQQYVQPTQSPISQSGHLTAGASQTPFGYEHTGPHPGPVLSGTVGGSYYHSGAMPQSGAHLGSFQPQSRPQFVHAGYGQGQHPQQLQPHPGSEHPPPPPMYVQHAPQQQQSPHIPQQGTPMLGSPPHSSMHPVHPHQNAPTGWHQTGPSGYPPQYGPPRYPSSSGPAGYAPHPGRHLPPCVTGGGYGPPPHPSMHQGPHGHHHQQQQQPQQVPTSGSEASALSQSQIPAPPPYQHQQQHGNFPPGYWAAPHQVPSEYGGPNQQQPPYMSGPHPDAPGLTHPSVDGMQPGPGASPAHPHAETTSGHIPPQQPHHTTAMYYPGYSHPPMPPSSYCPPGGGMASGFYSVPNQHQGSPYQPHGATVGSWAGGYSAPHHMSQHPHGYAPPPPQPPHSQPYHPQQQQLVNVNPTGASSATQIPSKLETAGSGVISSVPLETSVAGGASSRPPSVSN